MRLQSNYYTEDFAFPLLLFVISSSRIHFNLSSGFNGWGVDLRLLHELLSVHAGRTNMKTVFKTYIDCKFPGLAEGKANEVGS